MPFAYLRDPLFLTVFVSYVLHSAAKRLDLSPWWLRYYFNDVICIPFFVPLMLWTTRRLGLRRHDGAPTALEVLIPLLIWSAVFEVWLPMLKIWQGRAFADPYDVLCYAAGAWLAVQIWWWQYGVVQGQVLVIRDQSSSREQRAQHENQPAKPDAGHDPEHAAARLVILPNERVALSGIELAKPLRMPSMRVRRRISVRPK